MTGTATPNTTAQYCAVSSILSVPFSVKMSSVRASRCEGWAGRSSTLPHRAHNAIAEAELLAGAGHWEACVNRLYSSQVLPWIEQTKQFVDKIEELLR